MSFETLKISELKTIAEDFGVEIDGIKSKKDIITALEEDGVTWSVYQKQNADQDNFEDSEEEPSVAREELKSGRKLLKIYLKKIFLIPIHPYRTYNINYTKST